MTLYAQFELEDGRQGEVWWDRIRCTVGGPYGDTHADVLEYEDVVEEVTIDGKDVKMRDLKEEDRAVIDRVMELEIE